MESLFTTRAQTFIAIPLTQVLTFVGRLCAVTIYLGSHPARLVFVERLMLRILQQAISSLNEMNSTVLQGIFYQETDKILLRLTVSVSKFGRTPVVIYRTDSPTAIPTKAGWEFTSNFGTTIRKNLGRFKKQETCRRLEDQSV